MHVYIYNWSTFFIFFFKLSSHLFILEKLRIKIAKKEMEKYFTNSALLNNPFAREALKSFYSQAVTVVTIQALKMKAKNINVL